MLAVNPAEFVKMAYGDVEGFRELAGEFFQDVNDRQPSWREMAEEGDFDRLREELHRCKGGASIFGLERIVAMIKAAEKEGALELDGFDFATFAEELAAAKEAVAAVQQ